MTSAEAFEVWWQEQVYRAKPNIPFQSKSATAEAAWLAACAWQREQDAIIADHCGRGSEWPICDIHCCGKDIAEAVRKGT